ncbi:MAG: hypothetical protein M5R36_20790 [Deltaproteobacteria bacterium]|nr:hypothetical protein [Deltaproteobacteria bacterium]
MAPLLAVLGARQVVAVEEKEGRGAEILLFVVGLSVIHGLLVLVETSADRVYFFY